MRYQPTIQNGTDHLERIKRAVARGEWITALGLADELENYLNENEMERTKVLIDDLHAIVSDIQRKVNQVMNLTLK